jgi:hypothetical protein
MGPDIILDNTLLDGLYMDEVRVWEDTIPQDVMQRRRFGALDGDEDDLILYLTFDEALADLSARTHSADDWFYGALPALSGELDSDDLDLGDELGYYQNTIGSKIYPVYSSPVAITEPASQVPRFAIAVQQIKGDRGPQPDWLIGHSANVVGNTLYVFGGCETMEFGALNFGNIFSAPPCWSAMKKFDVTTKTWSDGPELTLVPLASVIGTALHGSTLVLPF